MSLRDRLKNLEREAKDETVVLVCPATPCSEEFVVHWNTGFEWIAHQWIKETGERSYREPHPDVLVVEAHEQKTGHPGEDLVYKATGGNWLAEFDESGPPLRGD